MINNIHNKKMKTNSIKQNNKIILFNKMVSFFYLNNRIIKMRNNRIFAIIKIKNLNNSKNI